MTALDDLRRDYRTAFLRYLPQRAEAPLHAGYEIGRAAVAQGLSILDLVQVHHEILLEVLGDTRSENLRSVSAAAAEFLLEVLAPHDMAQRGFLTRSGRPDTLRPPG